jgi:hypothetical protein
MGPVPSPVDSEDWLAAAAETEGRVTEELDEEEEEEGKARVDVTVRAGARDEEELGVIELVDRVVCHQRNSGSQR